VNFFVRESQNREDMNYFFRLSFETTKRLRKFIYDEMVNNNPDASDEELFELHKKEAENYFDFSDPNARIFIAEREDGIRCGYLWMGLRNSKDDWDLELPQWIYDVVVTSEFQGKGLGKKLMQKAEEFARDSKVNIGLFVHSDNEPAIALYYKMGYHIKVVPISKKIEQVDSSETHCGEFTIRKEQADESDAVRNLEFERFLKKVRFSLDATDEMIRKRYDEYINRYRDNLEKHLRLMALTSSEELVGSIWVGPSDFNEKVAMIFEHVVTGVDNISTVGSALIDSAERWAKAEGYSTLYMLLHTEDDLDLEFFKKREYVVPGFFMERRLRS
jgi:ribosomal protein S18 acetylase RimI-like enzyme